MTREFLVALDIGTSGCRAAAMRPDGSVAAQQSVPLLPARPRAGYCEYQATDLVQSAQHVLQTVLDKIGPQNAAALAVTSQRSTIVVWDTVSAQAVGPVLAWEDGRAQLQAQAAPLSQEQIHLKTGLYKTPFFSAPKIAWTLQHFPQSADLIKQHRLAAAPVASYLIWHLTGGHILATDYSLAQRTLLLDIHTHTWSETLCQAFGVPLEILPTLQPSSADYGAYTYKGVSIPIAACVGDQQAAAAYFGLQPQESLINYGTGAFWLYHTGQTPSLLPGMLTSLAAGSSPAKRAYLLEGPVNSAASALLWLKSQGICFEEAQLDELSTAAQNPVLFLPSFGGLGAPYWDFDTPTTLSNLSPRTRKEDWIAGTLRAIAFLLADIAAYLQRNGCKLSGPVYAAGGLSKSRYLTAFEANLLQTPLQVAHQADATVLGACLLAAKQLGQTCTITPQYTTVRPNICAQESADLVKTWQQFVSQARKKSA